MILKSAGGDNEKIAGFLAGISGLDRESLAFVVIATDWTEAEGIKLWSNTPEPTQMIALMHLALAGMTKDAITAGAVYLAD